MDKVNYVVYFPKDVVWTYDLKGKHLKFYVDEGGKAISWRVLEGEGTTLDEIATAREVKPMPNGAWTCSVGKLMGHAGMKIEESRSMIPVKRYNTTEMTVPMRYYYIEL